MTIKTITVSGVTTVNFDPNETNPYFYASEKYCWVKNNSEAAMYVSLDENCTAGADGTAKIGAGEAGLIMLSPTNKIYISGSGSAEVRTTDIAVNPFKAPSKGGESVLIAKTITANGTYSAAADSADGYSSVTVNIPSMPAAYRAIDYVNCGSGNVGQSGFDLYNYSSALNDVVEIITTTPSNTSESGFMGSTNGEAYYQNGDLYGYNNIVKVSNTAIPIEGGTVTKNTTIYSISRDSDRLSIGYYRTGQYKYQGRIYSVIISRPTKDASGTPVTGSSVVLSKLIPCIRNNDNAVGLFDLIYQVFYTSESGKDPFTAPEV